MVTLQCLSLLINLLHYTQGHQPPSVFQMKLDNEIFFFFPPLKHNEILELNHSFI